jgi:hypothetical protein
MLQIIDYYETGSRRDRSALRRDKSTLRRDRSALKRDKSTLRRDKSALRRDKSTSLRDLVKGRWVAFIWQIGIRDDNSGDGLRSR